MEKIRFKLTGLRKEGYWEVIAFFENIEKACYFVDFLDTKYKEFTLFILANDKWYLLDDSEYKLPF